MPFGNYDLHRSRRPGMNPRVLGGTDDEPHNRKFCPRCQFTLDYFEARDIWFCGKCAYNFPDELLAKNREEQEAEQQVKGGSAATADGVKEDNIVVVPMQDPRKKKKKDPFDYLKKDDAVYSEKLGWTLVTDHIDFSDDRSTISSEELRKQNLRLRGKTIR